MSRSCRDARAERARIVKGWQVCATAPGRFVRTEALNGAPATGWIDLPEPATAAAALRSVGRWSLDGPVRRFDAEEWWYRVEFAAPVLPVGSEAWLVFDGLAGVADVWLNGQLLAHSDNMFVASEHNIGHLVRPGANSLMLRFHALDTVLAHKRPRPRWRAPMVEHQQLRWLRTTLLGRTPGWSPPAAAVGPWKDIWLECRSGLRLTALTMQASVVDGNVGQLTLACSLVVPPGQRIAQAAIELEHEGRVHRTPLVADAGLPDSFRVTASIPGAALWWPHTHGAPVLYAARLVLGLQDVSEPVVVALNAVGFRSVAVDNAEGGLSVRVNGVPIFCRGACWTPLDVVSLRASPEAYLEAVTQARDAGMNMLRVGGTMVYEAPAFFDACDALGVMVWQEFMFANMDYPSHDADFMNSVRAEVDQQLTCWQARPSLTVVCGNSEVEQQAAMWGAARELWEPELFHVTLARWVNEGLAGVPYWPSSAHGGAFPHQSNVGSSSYYGVGAYLRPQTDARHAALRFATECLAFANVPQESTLARMPDGLSLRVHHPAWKARVPRDLGAGWDFDDVRDHYLSAVFQTDVLKCRYADHDRYLALSRAVTGELMAAAFGEWRRPGSTCGGALVLFLRDLWAGAGWGLLDDMGVPKPCFFALSRALQPVSVAIIDEGGNGLVAHVINEPAGVFEGELEVNVHGAGGAVIAQARLPLHLAGRGSRSIALAQGLGHFLDLSYAYRFGPLSLTLVHARLCRLNGVVASEAFFTPAGSAPGVPQELGLSAVASCNEAGDIELVVGSARFAHTVHIDLDGHAPNDNYFHLAPGSQRRIAIRSTRAGAALKGRVGALNSDRTVAIQWQA